MTTSTAKVEGAVITLQKCRNGWHVHVQGTTKDGESYDDNGEMPDESFVIPGDLDAENLGKEIVATIVSMRITEAPKRKR